MRYLAPFVAAMLLSVGVSAQANVVYTYTGDPFTDLDSASCPDICRISGNFVLSSPLGANHPVFDGALDILSFSFTDGVDTIDSADSTPGPDGATSINVGTDSSGAITQWNNQFFSATDLMFSGTDPVGCGGCAVTDDTADYAGTFFAQNFRSPGVWTSTITGVPEASTWAMLILGVAVIGFAARRSRGTPLAA